MFQRISVPGHQLHIPHNHQCFENKQLNDEAYYISTQHPIRKQTTKYTPLIGYQAIQQHERLDSVLYLTCQNESIWEKITLLYQDQMEEVLIEVKPSTSLDDLLENQVGYGNGQKKLTRSLYLLLFAEGCETIVLGLLIPKLGDEWNMGKFEKSLLITMVYAGVSLGSYLETYSDHYGRYKFLLFNAILTSIFGLLSVFCTTFNMFLITRFFYGIGIGIILPLTATYITEIVPSSVRGHVLTLSRIYWSAGTFAACVLGWFLLQGGHWRILLFTICLPSFYAIYDIHHNGKESLRYLWVRKDIDQVISIIDMLTRQNNRLPIPPQKLRLLMQEDKSSIQQQKISHFKQLLNDKYCKKTLILSFAWITACFIYYAVMLMLPSILSRHESLPDSFQYLFLIVISGVEVLSFFCSQYFMDHPSFGRKKTIYLFFMIIFFLSMVLAISGENNMPLLFAVFIAIKILSTAGIMTLYPYSAELYETMLRSTAMGIFSLSGRLATTLLGIIGISALEWMGGMGLYYIFMFLSFFTSVLIYQMPYCTLGRQLDV